MANDDTLSASELSERGEDELRSLLVAKKEDLHQVRFGKALGQLRETHRFGLIRKDIARIKTVLAQRSKEATS